MPAAALNGTALHHEVLGDGPPCLVLHGGLGVDHTYLRPGLDRLGAELRLVYYDHRGHGRSGRPPPETITVEQLADDADALAGALGEERVLVLGHAQGGFVAQELALRHPARVAGMILVATTPGELGAREGLADDFGPPPPVEVEILQRVPPAGDEEWAATMTAIAPYCLHRSDPDAAAALYARTVFSAQAAARSMLVFSRWSAVDRLAQVAAPALVLAGRHDVLCPPQQSERIARMLPGTQVVVFERSGHLPWLEEPDAFIAAVRAWLPAI